MKRPLATPPRESWVSECFRRAFDQDPTRRLRIPVGRGISSICPFKAGTIQMFQMEICSAHQVHKPQAILLVLRQRPAEDQGREQGTHIPVAVESGRGQDKAGSQTLSMFEA